MANIVKPGQDGPVVDIATVAEAAGAVATHAAAGDPHPGYTTAAELAAFAQPLDSDLTAIAALTTTAFGRGLLALADQAALLAAAGAQASDSDLTAIAGLSPSNDDIIQRKAGAWTNRTIAQLLTDLAAAGTTFQPLDSDLTSIAALATTSFGRGLLILADAAALLAAAGAQGSDATLTALAGLTIVANSLTIGTGTDAFAQTTFAANTFPARASTGSLVAKAITDFGLSLVDDADATAGRSTLGLVIGTNVPSQATFDDHSARHESGGADVISIAGLAGTPTELTNHLSDASDAHDASAVSFSPAAGIAATDVQAALVELAGDISGGGIPSTIVDVKGDLIAATAADAVARLSAGANDTMLMAASGETTGLKYATPAEVRTALGIASTLPTIVSVGAEFTSTGTPTATLPGTHVADDILVLVIQTSNQQFTTPVGYTQAGPTNGIGAAATAGSTKLCVFWKRDNGAESAPTLSDSGDHTYGFMFAVRGCPTTVDPFTLSGQSAKFTASATGTADKGTTVMDNCLVVNLWAHALDQVGAAGSSPTNASLTSVAEQFDDATSDGTGGGLYMMSGVMAARGDFAASTVTWSGSTVDVSTTLVFRPADSPENSRPAQVQTFIGAIADLDDTWVKPSGAVMVHVEICDGGGSGSGGNTTTTAAGGGGGGGGGFDEAWFRADDLAATITVHAGRGGAVGTALNQAGSVGVVSEFDKGGVGPLTAARRITGVAATAAASADGGNGGSGSGTGRVSPAVATTRLSQEVTTDGVAYGTIGGRGGSGTTAPTGGSPAQWGGGGGESGGDTDAALTADTNGYSQKGGGGGSGGRTNTNISVPGWGGGANAPTSPQGAAGTDSTRLPFGGSGGVGGGSSVVTGGSGGFPGGGGGGGAGVAGGFGGRGGHGCVVVTTHFS